MINKIEGPGSIRAPQTVRRTAKTSSATGPAFSKHLDTTDEVDSAAHASAAAGVSNVDGVFGIQEVDDALNNSTKSKRRAQDILDRLEELRLELLTGTLTKGKLLNLAQMVHTRRQEVTDPKLSAILDEIDLRAQVELAKYGPG